MLVGNVAPGQVGFVATPVCSPCLPESLSLWTARFLPTTNSADCRRAAAHPLVPPIGIFVPSKPRLRRQTWLASLSALSSAPPGGASRQNPYRPQPRDLISNLRYQISAYSISIATLPRVNGMYWPGFRGSGCSKPDMLFNLTPFRMCDELAP